MTFRRSVQVVLADKYVDLTGRAGRSEFWWFAAFGLVVWALLRGVDFGLGWGNVVSGLFGIAVLLPVLSVSVRRLHDTGRAGWWLLLVPTGVGVFLLLVLLAWNGTRGPNQFGPDPYG